MYGALEILLFFYMQASTYKLPDVMLVLYKIYILDQFNPNIYIIRIQYKGMGAS